MLYKTFVDNELNKKDKKTLGHFCEAGQRRSLQGNEFEIDSC